jgi:hypothetical protein
MTAQPSVVVVATDKSSVISDCAVKYKHNNPDCELVIAEAVAVQLMTPTPLVP